MSRSHKRIGEFLIDKGIITPRDLKLVLEEQKLSKEFIGEILLRMGLVNEEELARALAEQFDMPFMNLKSQDINWNIAKKFPSSFITEHRCMPIKEEEYYLVIAITNPLEVSTINEIEKLEEFRKVKSVLITKTNMKELINKYKEHHLKEIENLFK